MQVEARPWGLDTEPGRLNENQTGSGLRKKEHGFLENVLKEGKKVGILVRVDRYTMRKFTGKTVLREPLNW